MVILLHAKYFDFNFKFKGLLGKWFAEREGCCLN